MTIILALAAMLTGATVAGETCDISCKIEKALQGDGAAALEVAQESRRTQKPEIVANWLRIAAENGNAIGQWEYGVSLVESSQSRYDCIRAMYWFRQADQNGHASAGTSRRKVQEFLKEHPGHTGGCADAL
jgi:TPR repeat protein